MCDLCVINSVKDRMLSRRAVLGAGAAGAAAAVLGSGATPPAMAAGHGAVHDMTHTLDAAFPTFDGAPGIAYDKAFDFAKDGYNLYKLTINEHSGTHIDAPMHFSADGKSVDQIPVESLVCPLCVVDIRNRAAEDRDTRLTPDDLKAWIAVNGPIPEGACVAMNSGWADKLGSADFRGRDGLHFPGFHVEAAQMLIEETGAAAIAVDTLSLDHGPSADFATHYTWLPSGRYGIECLAGLDRMPATGATLVVGAPKVGGGTGGPARIFAMV